MHVTFLGTAAAEGTPAHFCSCEVCEKARKLGGKNIRTRSQCLVNSDLLIDYPPDTYLHTLFTGLDLRRVRSVLFTHSHADHFYFDDLLLNAFPFNAGEGEWVDLYGNQKVCATLQPVGENTRYRMRVHPLELLEEVTIGGYRVIPLRAVHDRNEQCLLYSIGQGNKRFLYGNDTGFFPPDTMERIRGLRHDVISLDCTVGRDRDGGNHMGFADIAEMKERLLQNGSADQNTRFVAHHFSHNCGYVYEDAARLLEPMGFECSYDGMELSF